MRWNKKKKVYSNYKYFSSFQKLCQCIIKLQRKVQITQQHNKSELKNTYRIKELKEDRYFKRRSSEK